MSLLKRAGKWHVARLESTESNWKDWSETWGSGILEAKEISLIWENFLLWFFFFFFLMVASVEEVKCSLLFLFSHLLCSFSLPTAWSTSKLWITEFWVFMEVSLGGSPGWMKEARQSQSPTHAQTQHDPDLQLHLSHFSLSLYVLWSQYSKVPSHALMCRACHPIFSPSLAY